MQSMTLEQLRATTSAGGIKSITLKGQGNGFFIQIDTRSGKGAYLSKARSAEARSFGNPATALNVLRDIGIVTAHIDATHWNPNQKDMTRSRESRGSAMREAHEAAAYNEWLVGEIQASLDDSRPNVTNEDAMSVADAEIDALKKQQQA